MITKKFALTLFLIVFFYNCFSQQITTTWYFGSNAGIHFDNGNVSALLDGELITDEGCASISDSNGDLLFYTDGSVVYNKNHEVMENGQGLYGDFSSTHSAIIIPKPEDENIYYIFTVDAFAGEYGLRYSIVDITYNGGLGKVIDDNIYLENPTTEKISAIKHPETNEYWIISHKWNSNQFISFKIDNSGVNTTPVISAVGEYVGGVSLPFVEAAGGIKISPNGKKVAVARYAIGLEIYDFDIDTGILSNPQILSTDQDNYGVEFSTNSKLLYISRTGYNNGNRQVVQYNLDFDNLNDIISSKTILIDDEKVYGALQLGPNGKIYVAIRNSHYLDVIRNVNVVGTACNYTEEDMYLGDRLSKYGLPPFIQSSFYGTISVENVCLGESTQFTLLGIENEDSVTWDFGDSNTSNETNPIHTYGSSGVYTVNVTVDLNEYTINNSIEVEIFDIPISGTPIDLYICDDSDNIDLTSNTQLLLNGLSDLDYEVVYFESIQNLEVNLSIQNPDEFVLDNNSEPQEIYAIVRSIDAIDCYDEIKEFSIIPIELIENSVTDFEACDNTSFGTDDDGIIILDLTIKSDEILENLNAEDFTLYYFNESGNIDDLTTAIDNPETYQNEDENETIEVKIVSNYDSLCYMTTTFNLSIVSFYTDEITQPLELIQCDDDIDGISIFNLNDLSESIQQETDEDLSIVYYNSEVDAINSENQIGNLESYENLIPNNSEVWVKIFATEECYSLLPVSLIVNSSQIPADFQFTLSNCKAESGLTYFDFSFLENEIQDIFSGQIINVSYYEDSEDALQEENEIFDISNYGTNLTFQEIYIKVKNENSDCMAFGKHLELNIVETPNISEPFELIVCDTDEDGIAEFDTSEMASYFSNDLNDVEIHFYDENGNDITEELSNIYVSSSKIINVKSKKIDDDSCFSESQLELIVVPKIIINEIEDIRSCDDNHDGIATFDTSFIENNIIGAQDNIEIIYTNSSGMILSSPFPLSYDSENEEITAKIYNVLKPECFEEITFNLIVDEVFESVEIDDYKICDDFTNDNVEIFDFTTISNQFENDSFEILYFISENDALLNVNPLPFNYQNISNPQTIYLRAQNNSNSNCYTVLDFNIEIFDSVLLEDNYYLEVCDDSSNDQLASFNLSDLKNEILENQFSDTFEVTIHESLVDAENKINTITNDYYENTISNQQLFIRVENSLYSECFEIANLVLNVIEKPELLLDENQIICNHDVLELYVEDIYDNYIWSTGETSNVITVNTPGIYDVTAQTITALGTICETTKSFNVIQSTFANKIEFVNSDWTFDKNKIEVQVEGKGDYEYSLDGENYQDEPIFEDLQVNSYTVYVRDKNGCGVLSKETYLLYYPQYFTPNGDGIHDYWQINNADSEKYNEIFIFDRYGKLISKFLGKDRGWDGTKNGEQLPSTDYWFLIKRRNGKEYRGHFTLKR
ncbi:T9SS type B sorting domain-containing protein [Aureivirga sp. CE67]|uniref:T9SS type B sorting domain-containing protein n=1 Tax=Aureivirga sp. CE67 TaxID=1788983 RepID=UPI0018C9EB96|nr:T9SS type B sorting domain-containing protein [Aureivirga sp. CE67]